VKEKYVTLYRYDCKIPDCPEPTGAYDSDKSHAWAMLVTHLALAHFDTLIKGKKFKRVKA
jgi:hypothetical protein